MEHGDTSTKWKPFVLLDILVAGCCGIILSSSTKSILVDLIVNWKVYSAISIIYTPCFAIFIYLNVSFLLCNKITKIAKKQKDTGKEQWFTMLLETLAFVCRVMIIIPQVQWMWVIIMFRMSFLFRFITITGIMTLRRLGRNSTVLKKKNKSSFENLLKIVVSSSCETTLLVFQSIELTLFEALLFWQNTSLDIVITYFVCLLASSAIEVWWIKSSNVLEEKKETSVKEGFTKPVTMDISFVQAKVLVLVLASGPLKLIEASILLVGLYRVTFITYIFSCIFIIISCRLTEPIITSKLPSEREHKLQIAELYLWYGYWCRLENQLTGGAIGYFNEALKIAMEQEHKGKVTEARLGLGSAYILTNNFKTAIEYYESALKIAKQQRNKQQEIEAYLGLGHANKLNYNFQTAIEMFEKALKTAKEEQDRQQLTEAYLGLGDICILNNQFETAIEYVTTAMRIALEVNEGRQDTRAVLTLGIVYRLKKQFSTAILYFAVIAGGGKIMGNILLQNIAYFQLGITYRLNNQFETAIEYFEKALELSEEIDDKQQVTEAHLWLGNVYRLKNQFQLAINNYEKALEIAKERADDGQVREAYLGLGIAYKLNNKFQVEISDSEAKTNAKERENKRQVTEAYLSLGDAYQLNNQYDMAIESYTTALNMATEQRNELQETEANLRLSEAHINKQAECKKEEALQIEKERVEAFKMSTMTDADINELKITENASAEEEPDPNGDADNDFADEGSSIVADTKEEKQSNNASADEGSKSVADADINELKITENASAEKEPDPNGVDKKKTEDERKISFEKKFLDSKDYSIKEEVHEKFRRFSWLSGAYGVTRPNRQIPYPHLYVTVKKGIKKSVVLRELKLEFNCNPKKYFEFRREPEKEPTFTYLSKPSSGGGILAISKDGAPNRISNEDEDEDEESGTLRQSGTLTMFCSLNGEQHYALTCLHVGCATDKQRCDLAFNVQDLFEIHNSIEWYTRYARERQMYYFQEKKIDNTDENKNSSNYTPLGNFHKSCFHCESDIMSIEVPQKVEVDCKLEKIEFPDWNKITNELQDRVYSFKSEDMVKVKKLGYSTYITQGYIVERNFTFNYNKEPLFKEAIVVKGEPGSFLESGDSGALIRFLDKNKEEQAFAYGVCEVDELYADQMTSDEDSDDGSQPGTSCEYACETDSSSLSEEEVISENAKATSSNECNVCHTKDKRYDSTESITIRDETGPYSICFKLNTALENLHLLNAGCFKECGGV